MRPLWGVGDGEAMRIDVDDVLDVIGVIAGCVLIVSGMLTIYWVFWG